MDDVSEVRGGTGWRMAVWGDRLLIAGAVIVVVGFVALLGSSTVMQWIVPVGMVLVVAGDVLVLVGISRACRTLPGKRPPFRTFRRALLHDAFHAAP